jgi:hypothetical protein
MNVIGGELNRPRTQMKGGEKRRRLFALVALEVVLILLTMITFILPVQDYGLREYKEWWSNRTPEAWKAFENKKEKEFEVHVAIGSAFGLSAMGLGVLIIRKRP